MDFVMGWTVHSGPSSAGLTTVYLDADLRVLEQHESRQSRTAPKWVVDVVTYRLQPPGPVIEAPGGDLERPGGPSGHQPAGGA